MNAKGYFAHVIPLQPGPNKVVLVETDAPSEHVELTVNRERAVVPISAGTFKLALETCQPHEEMGVTAGDIVKLSVRATPGSDVRVQLGKRVVELRPAIAVKEAVNASRHKRRKKSGKPPLPANVNVGLDAAYGKVFQRWPESGPDLYLGFYKVAADDNWRQLTPRFVLNHGGRSTSADSPARLSTIQQPLLAQTRHDYTTVRVGPGLGRVTPLPEGVRLMVDGWQGEQMRCLYSATKHVWIPREDLVFEAPDGESGPPPQSVVRTINILSDQYGADIVIPLNQRLPFQIEQHLKPGSLTMLVYGATADTDWVTPIVPSAQEHELIDHVTWKQVADGVYEVTALMKQARQWGFYGDYQGSVLHLHVKRPIELKPGGLPLAGLKICVDPGHGGNESGAIGCGGTKESQINLGIGLKLQKLLQQAGATVIMTRTADVEVSLEDRVKMATENNVDILLSIHNNALPDGRDPWIERGTSSYWYHPQAI
ncbi:MAG: N-acetylmuramoyl-L-alanine amidase family protein, partial [Terriglobales bacterium]